MTLPTKTTFTIDWTTFADVLVPGTYTATQLKALFNERDQELLDFVNAMRAVFVSIVAGSSGAESIGSAPISGVTGATIYTQLDDIFSQLSSAMTGTIPNRSLTYLKIALATLTNAEIAADTLAYSNMDTFNKTAINGGTIYHYRNLGGAL